MTPEQIYRSVHDKWTALSNGDSSISAGHPCAFCNFAWLAMEPGPLDMCSYCPAFHALGEIECCDHPAMGEFHDALTEAEAAMLAKAVLELLESVKDKIIKYMEESK